MCIYDLKFVFRVPEAGSTVVLVTLLHVIVGNSMTMESGAENQQSGDAAVTEAESQQMTVQAQPQIATLAQVSMPAAHATSSAPTVTLVQLPNGQTVQVHGVIQAAQPSVIQSPQVQTVQVCEQRALPCSVVLYLCH